MVEYPLTGEDKQSIGPCGPLPMYLVWFSSGLRLKAQVSQWTAAAHRMHAGSFHSKHAVNNAKVLIKILLSAHDSYGRLKSGEACDYSKWNMVKERVWVQ